MEIGRVSREKVKGAREKFILGEGDLIYRGRKGRQEPSSLSSKKKT